MAPDRRPLLAALGAALLALGPLSSPAAELEPRTWVLETAALGDLDSLIKKLANRQVVFVGEIHDRYEHHLNQLAIIRGLHARHPDLAIGLEFFQQPFQAYLDEYIAGTLPEKEFLRKTEYFSRWNFDYRLYRPILRFALEHRIPLVALNLPREVTQKVARQGLDALTPEERAQVPAELDRGNPAYRRRLEQVFAQHPGAGSANFEHFLEAQLLWDEGMAERAAQYLRAHPNGHLVILAGAGHLVQGQGIPSRLARRMPLRAALVLNDTGARPEPGMADYVLYPRPLEMPKGGALGIILDQETKGNAIKGFNDESPAEAAGLKKGDRILAIGGEPIEGYEDIRIALLDREPGEEVEVEVARAALFLGEDRVRVRVRLR